MGRGLRQPSCDLEQALHFPRPSVLVGEMSGGGSPPASQRGSCRVPPQTPWKGWGPSANRTSRSALQGAEGAPGISRPHFQSGVPAPRSPFLS